MPYLDRGMVSQVSSKSATLNISSLLHINYTPRELSLKVVNQVVWVQLLLSQASPKATKGKYTCVRACGQNYYKLKFLKRSDSNKIEASSPVS